MVVAHTIAHRSTCNRLDVGAVIAREGRIIATGYNGSPSGMPHCDHDGQALSSCSITVHAESNGIAFAARYGMPTEQAELYVTHSPCLTCAKLIVNAGIVRVVFGLEFRDLSGLDLLEAAGVETYCVSS